MKGTHFDMLDARIASALEKIIQNFLLQEKGQSGGTEAQKEDRIFRGRQIAYNIYDNFRVTGANDSVIGAQANWVQDTLGSSQSARKSVLLGTY